MSFIANLVWLIFGGLLTGLGYIIGGLLLCLTIIGIPFGLQAMQYGVAVFAPFGKTVTPKPGGQAGLALLFNIIWLLLFGWEIALAHILGGIVLGITIIGIPFAKQHFKLVQVALFPFSYRLE
jgi:uncharacterized membrane protein YccF (DUF307 family)